MTESYDPERSSTAVEFNPKNSFIADINNEIEVSLEMLGLLHLARHTRNRVVQLVSLRS